MVKRRKKRKARISAVINGGAPVAPTNVDRRITEINVQWRGIEDARELLLRRITDLKRSAARQICQSLRPKHDDIMKRLSRSLLETHAAYAEFETFKRTLLNNECGLYGVCDVDPDSLESPTDRTSSLAQFFREAKQAGYIKALPSELR